MTEQEEAEVESKKTEYLYWAIFLLPFILNSIDVHINLIEPFFNFTPGNYGLLDSFSFYACFLIPSFVLIAFLPLDRFGKIITGFSWLIVGTILMLTFRIFYACLAMGACL